MKSGTPPDGGLTIGVRMRGKTRLGTNQQNSQCYTNCSMPSVVHTREQRSDVGWTDGV